MANKKTVNVHTCLLSFDLPNQTYTALREKGSLDGDYQEEFMSLFNGDDVSNSSEMTLTTLKQTGMMQLELDTSETQFVALTKRLRAVSDKINALMLDATKTYLQSV